VFSKCNAFAHSNENFSTCLKAHWELRSTWIWIALLNFVNFSVSFFFCAAEFSIYLLSHDVLGLQRLPGSRTAAIRPTCASSRRTCVSGTVCWKGFRRGDWCCRVANAIVGYVASTCCLLCQSPLRTHCEVLRVRWQFIRLDTRGEKM